MQKVYKGFIYITTNLINNKKYIGKSTKGLKNYLGSGKTLLKAIDKYGKHNFVRDILAYGKDNEDLADLERYYIDYYNAQKSELFYNITCGGDGGGGHNSKEVYQYDITGTHLIAQYKSVSEAEELSGVSKTTIYSSINGYIKNSSFKWVVIGIQAKFKNKVRPSRAKGRKPIARNKSKVYQYSLLGKYIKSYEDILELPVGINRANVSACIRGTRKSSNGYIWSNKLEKLSYVRSNYFLERKDSKRPTLKKTILQLKDEVVIAEFESLKLAAEVLGVDSSNISAVCRGIRSHTHGFSFTYKQ